MGFIMDGLNSEAYDRTYTDREILRRIMAYFQRHLRVMSGVIVLIIVASCLDAIFPLLLSRGIDLLGAEMRERTIFILIAIILLAALGSWVCHLLREILSARVVGTVVWKLREQAFQSVMAHDLSFFDQFSAGKIATRVTSDTENFSTVVTLTLELFSQVVLFLLVAGVLCYINVRLALLTLAIVPMIFAVSLGFRRVARGLMRQSQRSVGRINSLLHESLAGITIAKNFRQEQRLYTEFQQINDQAYHVSMRADLLFKMLFPLLGLIANGGLVLIISFGGLDVVHRTISLGEWFLYVQALALLWVPLTSIAAFWSQFQQGLAASERVFALLDAQSHITSTGNLPVETLRGEIALKQVSFRYDQHRNVFDHLDLQINAGEMVALVGHTGAGKSSIGKLLARFYEFQQGELLIDGRDIRSLDLREYRRHVGIVPQTPYLFSGSVADNIRAARPQASDEEVEAVASRIGGGYWLKALPDGLATMVGE